MGEGRYWLQTLGCPKNQVDSDKLEGRLAEQGLRRASEPSGADLVVVNTCAFIESARQESIDTVLELADQRRPGARLVVTGCMAERYGSELSDALPEVDLVAGFGIDFAEPAGVPVALSRRPGPRPPRRLRSARAGPSRVRGSLGLREGGRGLRPHLRLLRHPVLPGQATVTRHGRGHGRGRRAPRRRDDASRGDGAAGA